MPFGGEDCLSAAIVLPVLPVLLVLPVLPVLSVVEGSVAEGSVAKELSISDRLPTKNRFFTAFRMTTFGFSGGPRPGATGFGSFCRNKMACPELALNEVNGPCEGTSSCGAETPQSSSPRRAGATPRKTKAKILDPRSRSGMTEGWMPDQAGHDGRRCGRAILWRFLPCGLPVIFCTVCKVLYNLYNLYMLYVLYNFSHCFKRLPFSIFGRTPARNFLCLLSAVVLGLFFST